MPSPATRKFLPGLLPRTWLYVAVAVALGIALFLLIWARQRGSDDFYRVDAARQTSTGQTFEPLPVPDTGGDEGEIRGPAPRDEADDTAQARIEEPAPAPQPATAPATPASAPAQPTAPQAVAESAPVPVSSPPPTYPAAALRRGETGEALLRVHVGPDGVPRSIDLVSGSGSRLLDRAATDAVRKWRFRPAMRDGQPVEGTVQVPIAFNAH